MNLLFFDIDGTLLPEGKTEISEKVVSAIKELKNEETKIFICTGRCYGQAKSHIDALSLDSYIVSNGQEVCLDGEIIYKSTMSKSELSEIETIASTYNLTLGVETRNNMVLKKTEEAEFVKGVIEGYGFLDVEISDELNDEIFQYWLFGEEVDLDLANDILKDKYTLYRWNEQCLEISPLNENKYNGITKVTSVLDNTITYGFGDGINDLEMLKGVTHSVAMGNACDEVKKISEYVTADINDDGLIKAFKVLSLGK